MTALSPQSWRRLSRPCRWGNVIAIISDAAPENPVSRSLASGPGPKPKSGSPTHLPLGRAPRPSQQSLRLRAQLPDPGARPRDRICLAAGDRILASPKGKAPRAGAGA